MAEVERLLASALLQFRAVLASPAPIHTAVGGFHDLGKASWQRGSLTETHPGLCQAIAEAVQEATPVIADAAVRWLPKERTYLLASGAVGLVSANSQDLQPDRHLYLTLLVLKLQEIICLQAVAERGDPLLRSISINRALATSPAFMTAH